MSKDKGLKFKEGKMLGAIFEKDSKVIARIYNRKEPVIYDIEMKDFGILLKEAVKKVREKKKSKR